MPSTMTAGQFYSRVSEKNYGVLDENDLTLEESLWNS